MGDPPPLYDGVTADELRDLVGAPALHVFHSTTSTMDVGHELARAGAPAGTVILADAQTAGRGRSGAAWVSGPGRGIWLTLIERPRDPSALDVLSLRAGLAAARALDLFADEPVRIKWPNDLFLRGKKLGGILIEARWRDLEPEWAAIGLGINVRAPESMDAGSLEAGANRIEVLTELVPEIRRAAAATGLLTADELAEFAGRDFARGMECSAPAIGVVGGISAAGELLIKLADSVARFRSGSLVLAHPLHPSTDHLSRAALTSADSRPMRDR